MAAPAPEPRPIASGTRAGSGENVTATSTSVWMIVARSTTPGASAAVAGTGSAPVGRSHTAAPSGRRACASTLQPDSRPFSFSRMGPSTRAEARAPKRMATCWLRGVAPTRKPVFRSCELVPPLEAAMQTMAPIDRAVT